MEEAERGEEVPDARDVKRVYRRLTGNKPKVVRSW